MRADGARCPAATALRRHLDAAWMKTRSPGLAEDVDPRFFLLAPEDQRLPRYIEGDEPIVSRNRGDAPEIQGDLPASGCAASWAGWDANKPG